MTPLKSEKELFERLQKDMPQLPHAKAFKAWFVFVTLMSFGAIIGGGYILIHFMRKIW